MYQWSNRQTYPIIISLQKSPWHALNSEHVLTHHSNPYKVSCLRLFSGLMKCSESMKAWLCSTSMFCKREYQIGIDSLLFRISPEKEIAVLTIPETCADKIITLCHKSLFAGHQGVIKTYLTISDKFLYQI